MTEQNWLGDNQLSLDIWHKKYQNEGETFEEWLDRVSGGVNEVKELIRSKKFLFGGRILANRGVKNRKLSYSNCFTEDAKVITDKGVFPIKDIKVGDKVLSDDGNYHTVNKIMSRDYSGDLYKITSPNLLEPIICTPNHKFLTKKGWKRIDRCFAPDPDDNSIVPDEFRTIKHNKDKKDFFEYSTVSNIEVLENVAIKVYNLSVEDTHTYTVNGFVTHNCYVVTPPEDNIESIFESAAKLARTYSFGGGCGTDISKLRPKDAEVHNAAKTTSGAVSFMDFYSYVTGLIGQSGRRGALMISIDCKHPDIEEFINLKTKAGVCEKANISVRVTDEFMKAALNDEDWITEFDSPETGKITKTFKAKDLLKLLAKRNWSWAEPGMLYWDRITGYNLLNNDDEFSYAGVNPCKISVQGLEGIL